MSQHQEHLSSYLARLKEKSAAAAGYMPPEELPAPPAEPVAAGAVRTAKAHRTRAAKAAKQAARRRDAYTGLGDVSGVLSRHAVRWRLRLHGGEGSAEFPPEAATAVKPDAAFDTRMALVLLWHAPFQQGVSGGASKERARAVVASAALAPDAATDAEAAEAAVRLVRLRQTGGEAALLIAGVWAETGETAFVLALLHKHGLVERAFGAGCLPPPAAMGAELDPLAGLTDYALTMEWEGLCGAEPALSAAWSKLQFCADRRPCVVVHDGTPHLACSVLSSGATDVHLRCQPPSLAWSAGAVAGVFADTFIATISLRDEAGAVFWAVCQPCRLTAVAAGATEFHYGSERWAAVVETAGIASLQAELARDDEGLILVGLRLFLSVATVQERFGLELK